MNLRTLGVLALGLLLPVAACDSGTAVDGPGTLTLLLTDDPGFVEAVVTIDRIELIGGNDGAVTLLPRPEDEDGWMGVQVNLLELQNEVLTLVNEIAVPAGSYPQLRMVMSGGCVATEGDAIYASSESYDACGDRTGRLQMPSFPQTGLKINLPGGALEVEGGRSIVLLDFVVSESFGHAAGNSGQWVMHPVVKASYVGFSGTITVNVSAADDAFDAVAALDPAGSLEDFRVELSGEGADTKYLTFQDWTLMQGDDGPYYTGTFMWLYPQMYNVELQLTERTDYTFTTEGDNPIEGVDVPESGDETVEFHVTGTEVVVPDTGGGTGG
ncbi:MAG: DUF4382 domain-containing protein [Gemmatimonadales bacterium]|nr:MAG: DUF4382 domain-containing protein [Gemmatimonadales bacterium]